MLTLHGARREKLQRAEEHARAVAEEGVAAASEAEARLAALQEEAAQGRAAVAEATERAVQAEVRAGVSWR
eukprot:SAG25_NODE_1835_length_2278_cov_7.050023_1_plen_70_part_10